MKTKYLKKSNKQIKYNLIFLRTELFSLKKGVLSTSFGVVIVPT